MHPFKIDSMAAPYEIGTNWKKIVFPFVDQQRRDQSLYVSSIQIS